MFRDGQGETASCRRTTGTRVFGGPAGPASPSPTARPASGTCTCSTSSSPTWTGTNPEVGAEFESILRFWLDRGVDGFRVDVAHGLVKEEGLPDFDASAGDAGGRGRSPAPPQAARCGNRTACTRSTARGARSLDNLRRGPTACWCAEAWVSPRSARPLRPPGRDAPGLQLRLPAGAWRAAELRGVIETSLRGSRGRRPEHLGAVQPRRGAARHPVRPARGDAPSQRHQGRDPQPDRELGLRRARAATR